MPKTFLILRDELNAKAIVREVGFMPEQIADSRTARANAVRWIMDRGNEQHDTLLSLLYVVTTADAHVIAAYQAVAAIGAH